MNGEIYAFNRFDNQTIIKTITWVMYMSVYMAIHIKLSSSLCAIFLFPKNVQERLGVDSKNSILFYGDLTVQR